MLTQFNHILIADVVLWDFATFDNYVDSLQSIIHNSVDPWLFYIHSLGSSLMSLMNQDIQLFFELYRQIW